jgi:membrane fusion protein, multidrug efflux system
MIFNSRFSPTIASVCPATALAIALAFLTGCGKARQERAAAQPELPPVHVRTTTVETRSMPAVEEVVGTVRAKLRATIEAKASGRIVELPVVLGQSVKAGDLLARLDAPEIKARLDQAEAGVQQAERDWKRVSSLYNQQAATRADYDAAQSRLDQAKAGVDEARAMLDYIEVKAPFNGVITRKVADVGDLAAPGKPLVELEDPSRLQMEADVPEAIAGTIKPGAKMTIRAGASARDLTAMVAEIAPTADPLSRTFRVKLDLQNDRGFMSGQFARLAVPVGETTSMRVPANAVVQRGQMEIVFAVENQHARLHLVKTGRQLKDEIEILSGLDSGDSVVVDNASQLVDGQPVTHQ